MKVPFTDFQVEYSGRSGWHKYVFLVITSADNMNRNTQKEFIDAAIREKIARELYANKTK